MNFDKLFQSQLDTLKQEGNYRVFAELQRKCGDFPRVQNHGEGQEEVTVWCSNDYLGMGQTPRCDQGNDRHSRGLRHRCRRHAQYLGQCLSPQIARGGIG